MPVGAQGCTRSGCTPARASRTARRRSSSCAIPGPDRPSTLLVLSTNTWQAYNQWGGRACTAAPPRSRSGGRSSAATSPAPSTPTATTAVSPHIGDDDPRASPLPGVPRRPRVPVVDGVERMVQLGAALRRVGGARGHRARLRRRRRPRSATPHLLDGRGCCSPSVTTSTGRGRCAITSTSSSRPAATGRSCPATRASGRCGTRADHDSMICYKTDARVADPVAGSAQQHLLTSCWSDPLIGRPETSTIGLTFTRGGYHRVGDAVPRGAGGYTVVAPEHWVFAGTDLRYGDEVGARATAVGYEVDGCALHGHGRPCRCRPAKTARRTRSKCSPSAPAHLISITRRSLRGPGCLVGERCPAG